MRKILPAAAICRQQPFRVDDLVGLTHPFLVLLPMSLVRVGLRRWCSRMGQTDRPISGQPTCTFHVDGVKCVINAPNLLFRDMWGTRTDLGRYRDFGLKQT